MGLGGNWGSWRPKPKPKPRTTRRTSDRDERDWRAANAPTYNASNYTGYYNRTPQQSADASWWSQNVPREYRTHTAFSEFMGGEGPGAPAGPLGPLGPGGGGRGYGGGGGGGGGGAAMTQAMFDQMLAALGTRAPQLTLSQVNLPDFRGTNVPAFNAQPYRQMANQLATATNRDRAAINQGAQQTTRALAAFSANPYAGAAVAPPPPAEAQGAALQATAGGTPGGAADANAAAAAGVTAGAGAETAAFNDLLKVLGANYNQSQNSRLGEVQMTAQSARNQLGAQNLGLTGQINMARNQGFEQWRQQDAERRYQNSLMAQQWNREELTRNQDISNQQAQGRWQQSNEMIANRLTPLLQLIQGTAGTSINMDELKKILQGWSS